MWRIQANSLRVTFPRNRMLCVLLLAGLVTMSSCDSGSHASNSLPPTVQATPTTVPIATPAVPTARKLVWTPERLPATQLPALPDGIERQGPTLSPAQSDGATAYVCAPAANSANADTATWLTHDRGASWRATADIAVDVGSPIEVLGCEIVVDATQATTAVAQVGYVAAGGCFPVVDCVTYALYLTTDAGLHWAPFHGPDDILYTLATYQHTTYAVFHSTPRSASDQTLAFVMSRDNLRTWTLVPGLTVERVTDFWLNPFNGDLLVLANEASFLTSTDGGSTWTALAAHPISFAFYDIVVQQPFTDQPWSICGGDPAGNFMNGVQQNKDMDSLACTADSGTHWRRYHLNVPNTRGGAADTGANYTLVGIADDGSVLLTTPAGLARVTTRSAAMQALGPAPNAGLLVYAAGNGAGVLWAAPQGGYTDPDPQGHIFTARYS